MEDFDVLNALLLRTAREHFGVAPPPRDCENDWWWDGDARAAFQAFRRAHKAWHNHPTSTPKKTALNRAQTHFKRAKRAATIRKGLSRLDKIAAGDYSLFFRVFKRHREPFGDKHNTGLNSDAAARAWGEVFSAPVVEGVTPIVDRPPLALVSLELSDDALDLAIQKTKDHAAGPDGLAMRFIKVVHYEIRDTLVILYTKAMREGLPPGLKTGRTILIPKTAPSADPLEFRPITVLPCLARIYHKCIELDLTKVAEGLHTLSPFQAGFRPGRCTFDQAFLLSTLASACRKANPPMPLMGFFGDTQKMFDTILHEMLIDVMHTTLHLPLEWIEVVRQLLIGSSTSILGREVSITRGCLHGSPLSPLLCNFMFEDLYRYLQTKYEEGGIPPFPLSSTPQHTSVLRDFDFLLTLLAYADDTAGLNSNYESFTALARHISDWHTKRRLTLNLRKSEAVVFSAPGIGAPNPLTPLHIDPTKQVQWASDTKYLGMRFTAPPPTWTGKSLTHLYTAADRAGPR